MASRAFLAVILSFFSVLVLLVVLSPSVSSSPQSLPTFTPVPTFTPLPAPTPTPPPPRPIAVFTVTEWGADYYNCSSNCSYTEDWRRPPSGTVFILYEGSCLTIPVSHIASIAVADNHPGPSRYRYFHLAAAPLTTSPVTLTVAFSTTAAAGPAACWCNQAICGHASSAFEAKVSCWDQAVRIWSQQPADCGSAFYVFTSTTVRCLPSHIRDFYFDYRFDLGGGCLYATCGGSVSSRGSASLVICAGGLVPLVPTGCRCEGPGTCYWCPASQRFEVRGTNPPANGVVQLSDWTGAELYVLEYGHELIVLPHFTLTRRITLTQPGYWYLDTSCPLPIVRGDLGYLSRSLSLDVACPNDVGHIYAYYAPSPTTRLVCTIPAGTWLVTGFPPVAQGQDTSWLGYTRFVSLSSPIFVISNSYAISEVWTAWDIGGGDSLRPRIPTSTVPVVTRPVGSQCLVVPPDLFAQTFDVSQVEVCLDLVAFRFSDDMPWGNALLDVLVLGVAAILVFAGIRSLRE